MPAKGHRKGDPVAKLVHFRAHKETIDKLEFVAGETKQSKSEVIRNGIEDEYQKIMDKKNG